MDKIHTCDIHTQSIYPDASAMFASSLICSELKYLYKAIIYIFLYKEFCLCFRLLWKRRKMRLTFPYLKLQFPANIKIISPSVIWNPKSNEPIISPWQMHTLQREGRSNERLKMVGHGGGLQGTQWKLRRGDQTSLSGPPGLNSLRLQSLFPSLLSPGEGCTYREGGGVAGGSFSRGTQECVKRRTGEKHTRTHTQPRRRRVRMSMTPP